MTSPAAANQASLIPRETYPFAMLAHTLIGSRRR